MPGVKKATVSKSDYHGNAIVSDEVKDPGNDSFVLKQVAAAKEFLNWPGMQEQLRKLAEKHKEKA